MQNKILSIKLICLIFLATINLFSQPVPRITDNEKFEAITSIREQSEVIRANIKQDGDTVSLSLIVEYGTPRSRAMELGESFIRLMKKISRDKDPGEEIGEGIYEYLVTVSHPNEKEIVAGTKAKRAKDITWL